MKYFVYEKTPDIDEFNTVLKCRQDIRSVLVERGYKPIHVPSQHYETDHPSSSCVVEKTKQTISTAQNFKIWIEKLKCTRAGDIVFIQYPPLNWTLFMNVLLWLKMRRVYLICIIHDLDSYRDSEEGKLIKNWYHFEDTHSLSFFNQIIVQNSRMRRLLLASGYDEKKIINLRMFDYLTEETDHTPVMEKNAPVVITGNFDTDESKKMSFIYADEEKPGVRFNIYGTGVYEKKIISLDYEFKGNFPASHMPGMLEGSFGLVWDGNSLGNCGGNWGEYLRIDNPLKFSLYLAAGMPVIIWSEAALAGFVKKYEVGFTIDSLYEIEEKIKQISDKEYKQMQENIKPFSKAVKEGCFFAKAIERAELRL